MSNSPANLEKIVLSGELLGLGLRLGSVAKRKKSLLLIINNRD